MGWTIARNLLARNSTGRMLVALMADRTYVYIDGESHYIRAEEAWQKCRGSDAALDRLRYVDEPADGLVLVIPEAKVFWTRKMSPGADRAVYFTAASGDDITVHETKMKLRQFGLEASVVVERRDLANRRANVLKERKMIEKAKGSDIALAVRMIEDAFRDAYQVCHLYTSDIDFLPVIQAVRSLGKQVFVYGFKNGLSKRSELLVVPDNFSDIEEILQNECQLLPSN